MQLDTEKDAKHSIMALMAGRPSPREAIERLADYESYLENASDAQEREFWRNQVDEHRRWIESDEFRTGEYAQGINSDFLELVEWRSEITAFLDTPGNEEPFGRYEFFGRWLVGANYAVFSLLGRLISRDERDNSLANAWDLALPHLNGASAFSREELSALAGLIGQSAIRQSDALRFRNKAVAHNEAMLRIEWKSVDREIRTLARIWSLVNIWSEGPVLFPFPDSQKIFRGLETIYSTSEIAALHRRRDEYLGKTRDWCHTNAVTGEVDSTRSPFASISASLTPIGNAQ